jgi:hypothetical protein
VAGYRRSPPREATRTCVLEREQQLRRLGPDGTSAGTPSLQRVQHLLQRRLRRGHVARAHAVDDAGREELAREVGRTATATATAHSQARYVACRVHRQPLLTQNLSSPLGSSRLPSPPLFLYPRPERQVCVCVCACVCMCVCACVCVCYSDFPAGALETTRVKPVKHIEVLTTSPVIPISPPAQTAPRTQRCRRRTQSR